uniref:Guanylate cyclase domain-containing protein n=1 Tax=Heterorhabditis bacteriophora TaxID=37862 RepID=A0A1I7XD72_HETBA
MTGTIVFRTTRITLLEADYSKQQSSFSQTTAELCRVTKRSVLPKIGSTVIPSDRMEDLEDNSDVVTDIYRATPIHASIKNTPKLDLNYSEIPNNELLHSTPSTARETIGEPSIFTEDSEKNRHWGTRPHHITLVDMKLANLPSKLPGLNKAHSTSSPWRSLLDFLAPEGEFIEYEELARLIHNSRPQHKETLIMPDVLSSKEFNDLVSTLPSQPSSTQEMREKGRAQCQVMTEIEVLLMRKPDIDLDRLKMATVQKTIAPSEMTMLLELYGLDEHFKPFQQRLINSFLTHDDKFHFSAFIACLNNMHPLPIHQMTTDIPQEPPWNKTPLALFTFLPSYMPNDQNPLLTCVVNASPPMTRKNDNGDPLENLARVWPCAACGCLLGLIHLFLGSAFLVDKSSQQIHFLYSNLIFFKMFDILTNNVSKTAFAITASLADFICAILCFIAVRRLDRCAQLLLFAFASFSLLMSLAIFLESAVLLNKICVVNSCENKATVVHSTLIVISLIEFLTCVITILVCYRSLRQAFGVTSAASPYSTLIVGDYSTLERRPKIADPRFVPRSLLFELSQ